MKKAIGAVLMLITVLTFSVQHSSAQSGPFSIYLQPAGITGLPGIQAYVWGQHEGKWLVMGGRLDGLHRRQASSAFDVAGNNNRIYVIDPVAGQQWSAPLTALPVALQEQLSATNMQFHQRDTILYCIGGYGYSATAADHITHSNIVAVNVPRVIDAVIGGTSVAPYFRYQTDVRFAVTGGHLEQIYDTWYLLGGNRFDGRYNPMGGPSYTQVYTNEARRFTIADDGTTFTVTHLPYYNDTAAFHRRDYNAVSQILPDGKEGITVFSGVFQLTADIPYLNSVTVDSAGYAINTAFSQYYNHYHSAVMPVYSAAAHEMHNVFFGGIAQYYDNAGTLTEDNNVPFVKTIARVTRDAAGTMTEYKLPVEMPGLLGASAEFIPAEGIPAYHNHVLKLDDITADTTLAGYIFGGISSTAPNIFTTNTGTQSSAYSQLIKVYLVKNSSTTQADALNPQSTGTLRLQLYPNPSDGNIYLKFNSGTATHATLTVADVNGRVISRREYRTLAAGDNLIRYAIEEPTPDGTYVITLTTPEASSTQRIVIKK